MTGDPVLVLARFVYYASVAVLFGASLFPFYALRGSERRHPPLPRAATVVLGSAAPASAAAWLLSFAGSLGGSDDLTRTLAALLLESSLGSAWIVRLSLTLLLLFATILGRISWTAAVAFLALLSEGWSGHGATAGLIGPSLHAVHAVSAAAWIGGLLPLASVIAAARRPHGEMRFAEQVLWRFSRFGVIAVSLIAVTGSAMTWLMVGGVPGLAESYDRLLLLKIGLFASMAGLAACNRHVIVPRLARREPGFALRTLSITILLEQIIGLGVLLDVSALGLMDPSA